MPHASTVAQLLLRPRYLMDRDATCIFNPLTQNGLVFTGQIRFNMPQTPGKTCMLLEPTNLAAITRVIADTLQNHYNYDPVPLFRAVDLDIGRLPVPGARYPFANVQQLWSLAVSATGDSCFGLVVGARFRLTTFHALGFSWLASYTLRDSLKRLCRYHRVISTVPAQVTLTDINGQSVLAVGFTDPAHCPTPMAIDAFMLATLHLCQQASSPDFTPLEVHLRREDEGHANEYARALQAPVFFAADENAFYVDTVLIDQPLPGHNIDLAQTNDRAVRQYLENMDRHLLATEVKKVLIGIMPSGKATQGNIARHMNRSLSTLQRQLNAEGTSFRDIAAETKCTLAEGYIEEGKYTLSQIAYLLGFSDQSSFTRAFRRWTGSSPGEFRH